MPDAALGLTSDSYTTDMLMASTDLYLSEKLIPNVMNGVLMLKILGGKDMIDMTQTEYVSKKDTLRLEEGGQSIFVPLLTEESSLYQALDEFELVSHRAERLGEPAFMPWREVVVPCSISRREKKLNQGSTRIFSIWDQRLKRAEMSFMTNLEIDLTRGDQTDTDLASLDSSKRPMGFTYFIEEDPDNTTARSVAGITVAASSAATNTWWQNKSNLRTGTTVNDASPSFETIGIVSVLKLGYEADGGDGIDETDAYVTTSTMLAKWWDEIDDLMRFAPGQTGDLGAKVMFRGVPVYRSKALDNMSTVKTNIYGLCTPYFQLVFQKDSFFARNGVMSPFNQLSESETLICMLNLICTNRRRQFVIADTD